MFNIIYVLLFVSKNALSVYASSSDLCPEEHSQFSGTGKSTKITWREMNSTGRVVSEPMCLDKNYNYLTRICTQEKNWDPAEPPSCAAVQRPFEPSCLPSHIQVDGLCVSISPPQQWTTPSAPPAALDITEPNYLSVLHSLGIAHAWLPVRRVEPFGKLLWMTLESWYTEYTHPSLINTSPSYDCVVIKILNGTEFSYIPEMADCNSSYPYVHLYTLTNSTSVQWKKYVYSLNSSIFYYLNFHKSGRGPAEFSCNKLAEPQNPVDNYIIKSLFKNVKKYCVFGLKRRSDGQNIWQSSGKPITYADWIFPPTFEHGVGAPSTVMRDNGWKKHSLTIGRRFYCAVCEDDLKNYALDLTLQLNKDRTALVLSVYGKNHFLSITCTASGLAQFDFKFDLTNPVIDNDERSVYLLTNETLVYGFYQCRGLTIQNGGLNTIITKKVLFDFNYHVQRFAFEAIFKQYCAINICDLYVEFFFKYIEENIQDYIKQNSTIVAEIQAKKIMSINYINGDLMLLFHVLLFKTNDIQEMHEILLNAFENLFSKKVKVGPLASISMCLPSSTESGNETLHWDDALVGSTVLPRDPCFQADGLPVTRSCTGDRMSGARWTNIAGICHLDISSAPIHSGIYGIYTNQSAITAIDAVQNLSSLTKKAIDLSPSDIYFVSQILSMYSSADTHGNESSLGEDVVATVSNMIAANASSLKISGRALNSTNVLLESGEQLIQRFTKKLLNSEGVYRIVKPNLLYQISDPFVQGITGIAIFSNEKDVLPFTEYKIKNLNANTTVDDLVSDSNLEMAAFIPEQLLNDIRVSSSPTVRILIYFYHNDSLFVEGKDENLTKVTSKVLGISIEGYESYLRSPVRVVIKSNKGSERSQCAYWDFGSMVDDVTYASQWVVDAGMRTNVLNTSDNYEVCEFLHLTHFARLVGIQDDPYYKVPYIRKGKHMKTNLNSLDIITTIGCTLSVFGVAIIFMTAFIFKSWRESLSTKILLNVSVCILLQLIVLYVADLESIAEQGVVCVVVGALLHYLVLCGFGWSGVAAVLQWRRLVRVLGVQESHLLLRAGLAGWVAPSIPVAATLLLDAGGYSSGGLCYPQGTALYAAVLAPGAIIVLLNLVLFGTILRGISSQQAGTSDSNRRLHWAVLLFFLLGLPWTLGLLAASGHCAVCVYLFCATATLQGFILSLFCVILHSSTRELWIDFFLKLQKNKSQSTTATDGRNLAVLRELSEKPT